MAVYKIFAEADATIYSKYPTTNAGLDEILEVSVKNSSDPNNSVIAGIGPVIKDDLRRSLVRFSDSDLQKIKGYTTGSWNAFLKMYLANAENLNTQYYLEFRQVSQSWEMGTGHFGDYPPTRNGVCWYTTQSYYTDVSNWANPQYYLTTGGGSWNSNLVTQSFDYASDKDVNVNVTSLVNLWFSGSVQNYGFIVKHPQSVENNSGSYVVLNFYSNDTHTVYPPTLEMRWDDSVYVTGSLQQVTDSNSVITLANNIGTYKKDTEKVRFRVNSRDKYPQRTFTTSSLYTTNKRLPQQSYWSLVDAKSNEKVVDFDDNYTKISCDGTSSYFDLHMIGLEPERYYKVLIKCAFSSGEVVEYDNSLIFKVIN